MITLKELLDHLFQLAVIERWNDHPKPFDITELDKQAHKAIIAYLLAKIEENENKKSINWNGLIDGIIFEALQRAILTDIKPKLFHKLLRKRKRKIADFVINNIEPIINAINSEWGENLKFYFLDDTYLSQEKEIIDAAHFLATYWEFQFIYNVAQKMYGVEKVKQELENKLEDFHNLLGVQRFLLRRKLYGFINLCGQLRFQKRWTKVVRIPRTSVMGHMLMVAILSYAILKREKIENKKFLYATFMSALFHDLPEIITRDIVAPLKNRLGEEIIKEAEIEGIREEVYPLLPEYIRKELACFLAIPENEGSLTNTEVNEFSNRLCELSKMNVEIKVLENKDFHKLCALDNEENSSLIIPGELIKQADKAVAYAEAVYSINFGVKTNELMNAAEGLRKELLHTEFAEIAEALKSN